MVGAIALVMAVLLDYRFGEPARCHPLVGFGYCATNIEQRLNRAGKGSRLMGVLALLLCVLPALLLSGWLWWWLLADQPLWAIIVAGLGVYFSVGWRSLIEHVTAVQKALDAHQLPAARAVVARIVSRDCQQADTLQVRRAALESLLENSADAVVAPLFWFAVAGLPGALVYRLSNTLDAMWGYKNSRFRHFGWAAARWDDVLNYLPARLTALAFVLIGNSSSALQGWRQSAGHWSSPNAGPVISAGAGALQLSLGGGGYYHKQWQAKPATAGDLPTANAIPRAVTLVNRALVLLLMLFVLLALLTQGARL